MVAVRVFDFENFYFFLLVFFFSGGFGMDGYGYLGKLCE